jgi:DNA-binding protein H-NS
MARQVASNLAAISVDKLLELRSQIDRHLVQRRAALETELSRLGATASARGGRNRRASTKGTKVPPKYRGPHGELWSGRGVHPRWLAVLLKQGHAIEEYAIGQRATSRTKVLVRKSSKKKAKKKSPAKRR